MEKLEKVDGINDELVLSYFELDQASIPYSNDRGGYGDPGMFDENIPGFEPIKKRRNGKEILEQNTKENFSGGIGYYVWPWSSQVPYSQNPSMTEARRDLGLYEKETRMNERAIESFLAIELNLNRHNLLPSHYSEIDWKKEVRKVYLLA